jgi:hypothetical protein
MEVATKNDIDNVIEAIQALATHVDRRFDEHDRRFDEHDRRFDEHDLRFDEHDRRFDKHDQRFDQYDEKFDALFSLIDSFGHQTAANTQEIKLLGSQLDRHIQGHA